MHDAFRHHSRVDLPDRVASLLKTDAVRTEPRGGAITGDRWRVELADGREVFAKTRVGAPDGFFAVEADGLGWLADAAGGPPVPEVLAHDDEVLLLPWMREEEAAADAPERLGRELAALHSAGAASFGAERDGWIGAAGLDNRLAPDWPEFYADRRLDPYVRTLRERGELGAGEAAVFSRLTDRLEELAGPPEPPARLHGDLSSGNVLWSGGRGWLVDPAAHGGHRETDLAMLALFGARRAAGLDRLLAAYDEVAPLTRGWRERVRLHQLHPLLVHAVLFPGGSYLSTALRYAAAYAGDRLP